MTDKKFNPNDHMLDLRGKKYLPVNARVAWFRDKSPDGSIDTEIVALGNLMMARARIIVSGIVIAVGHATVRDGKGQTWAGREVEKAETAAIGRALALAGFGTMNAADELDDTDYLSDTPIDTPTKLKQQRTDAPPSFSPAQPPKGYTERSGGPDSVMAYLDYPNWQNIAMLRLKGAYNASKHVENAVMKLRQEGAVTDATTMDRLVELLAERKNAAPTSASA